MRFLFFSVLTALLWTACTSAKPKKPFVSGLQPPLPDYQLVDNWAALPQTSDPADRVPSEAMTDQQATAQVDVFFLHPTTYTGHRGEKKWNATVADTRLNKRTDESTILHQASVFNGAGRVFAPRYRQAHLYAYRAKDTTSAQAAFALAYSDVRRAFQHYLTHYNEGRPIILAAHSQGTNHATALLKEFFDGQALQQQLVAAYLVGMPIRKKEFATIPPCQRADDFGCFCSWRTFKRGHLPKRFPTGDHLAVINPLSWTSEGTYAGWQQNAGGVLRNFDKGPKPELTDAQVESGVLWAAKPRFFGKIFITFKNYHIADYNLYYANIRQNAQTRVAAFLGQSSK